MAEYYSELGEETRERPKTEYVPVRATDVDNVDYHPENVDVDIKYVIEYDKLNIPTYRKVFKYLKGCGGETIIERFDPSTKSWVGEKNDK